MKPFRTKSRPIPGTDYMEIEPRAREIYYVERRRTKRKPYVRSAYFKTDKVSLDLFWQHLHAKNRSDRNRRLKFYGCALELLRHTRQDPSSKEDGKRYILHRFAGISATDELFFVQVREDKSTGYKDFMSVFPIK